MKSKRNSLLHIPCFIVGILCIILAVASIPFNIFHVGNVLLIIIGLLSIAFPLILKWFKDKKTAKRIVLSVYSFGAAILIIFSSLMTKQAWFTKPPETGEMTVIVLGCGLWRDQPSLMLAKRLNAAKLYLDKNPAANCIVSGGQGHDELVSEASAMYNYLVRLGVDSSRIQQEDQSTNTRENLRFSKSMVPDASEGIIIATDAFHQYRASITAKSEGLTPLYTVSSFTPPFLLPSYWMRDLAGIPLTWLEANGIKII